MTGNGVGRVRPLPLLAGRPLPLLLTLLLAVGCGRADDEAAQSPDTQLPPAGSPTTGAPGSASTAGRVTVTDVQLGRSVGADRRVTNATTEFQPRDTIYVSVVTSGTGSSANLTARWTYQDGQLVDETSQSITPAASNVTEFHVSRPGGWPAGRYQVQVLVDGAPAQTREFQVRGG